MAAHTWSASRYTLPIISRLLTILLLDIFLIVGSFACVHKTKNRSMNNSSLRNCLLTLSLIFISLGCSNSPGIEPGVSLELAQFRKANISDITYELYFNIPAEQSDSIQAQATISFEMAEEGHDIQLDFRESREHLKSLSINGEITEISFEYEHIILPSEYLVSGSNTVDIDFIAGESSLNRNPDYLYTLFVPDRARTAFPLFDQPDLKAVYDLTLEIPKDWEAIANAPINYEHASDSSKTLNFAPTELISSYLFSFGPVISRKSPARWTVLK